MSDKALIVGPNIGVSMGRGGGVKVATKMAEALAENNFAVCLSAFKGYSLERLDSIHNTSLMKHRSKILTHYLVNLKDERHEVRVLSGVLPIHVGVLPFSIYLKYVIKKFSPRILIFHDDIPFSVKNELRKRLTFLYVHFSYATRLKLGVGDIAEMAMPSKQGIEKFLNPLLKRLIFVNSNPADIIIANSSVTANFLNHTWNRNDIVVLHPPINTNLYKSSRIKENLAVSIGAIQPNKRFGDVIRAMSTVSSDCQLTIIGHHHQGKYYHGLQKLTKKMGLKRRVTILLDASQRQVKDVLSRAKTIVHASQFEPFGIAVVEGMAAGCAPIVYKGATSGPWVDISNMGEFGLGFQTINELAENIERIMSDDNVFNYYSRKARERSKSFDASVFKKRFMEMLKTYL